MRWNSLGSFSQLPADLVGFASLNRTLPETANYAPVAYLQSPAGPSLRRYLQPVIEHRKRLPESPHPGAFERGEAKQLKIGKLHQQVDGIAMTIAHFLHQDRPLGVAARQRFGCGGKNEAATGKEVP